MSERPKSPGEDTAIEPLSPAPAKKPQANSLEHTVLGVAPRAVLPSPVSPNPGHPTPPPAGSPQPGVTPPQPGGAAIAASRMISVSGGNAPAAAPAAVPPAAAGWQQAPQPAQHGGFQPAGNTGVNLPVGSQTLLHATPLAPANPARQAGWQQPGPAGSPQPPPQAPVPQQAPPQQMPPRDFGAGRTLVVNPGATPAPVGEEPKQPQWGAPAARADAFAHTALAGDYLRAARDAAGIAAQANPAPAHTPQAQQPVQPAYQPTLPQAAYQQPGAQQQPQYQQPAPQYQQPAPQYQQPPQNPPPAQYQQPQYQQPQPQYQQPQYQQPQYQQPQYQQPQPQYQQPQYQQPQPQYQQPQYQQPPPQAPPPAQQAYQEPPQPVYQPPQPPYQPAAPPVVEQPSSPAEVKPAWSYPAAEAAGPETRPAPLSDHDAPAPASPPPAWNHSADASESVGYAGPVSRTQASVDAPMLAKAAAAHEAKKAEPVVQAPLSKAGTMLEQNVKVAARAASEPPRQNAPEIRELPPLSANATQFEAVPSIRAPLSAQVPNSVAAPFSTSAESKGGWGSRDSDNAAAQTKTAKRSKEQAPPAVRLIALGAAALVAVGTVAFLSLRSNTPAASEESYASANNSDGIRRLGVDPAATPPAAQQASVAATNVAPPTNAAPANTATAAPAHAEPVGTVANSRGNVPANDEHAAIPAEAEAEDEEAPSSAAPGKAAAELPTGNDEASVSARAGALAVAGRYREALPLYQGLARDFPKNPAYAAMVRILGKSVGTPASAP